MANVDNFLPAEDFRKGLSREAMMPPQPEASRLLVACYPANFCASALARAIEDTNAHLINMNVTAWRLDDGRLTIELRTNRLNSSAAARSLERYGYEVIATDETEPHETDSHLRARAAELLNILEM